MDMSATLNKHFADVEAKVGPISDDIRTALARLDELEQKSVRRVGAVICQVAPADGCRGDEGDSIKVRQQPAQCVLASHVDGAVTEQ